MFIRYKVHNAPEKLTFYRSRSIYLCSPCDTLKYRSSIGKKVKPTATATYSFVNAQKAEIVCPKAC